MGLKVPQVIALVSREPYRLFFPLGIFFGMMGTGHWLFYALGWIPSYSGFYHSTTQMMTYMGCFVTGFLLTAMPRFSAAPHATREELLGFLVLMLGIFGFLSFGRWIAAECCYIGWLLALGLFFVSRVAKKRNSPNAPPAELLWIPTALFLGIFGTALLILGQLRIFPTWSIKVGKPMMEQGFLLSIVIGIGGFLIPRIMGTFKVAESEKDCALPEAVTRKQHTFFVQVVMGALFFLSFWLEGLGKIQEGYGLRAFVVTSQFLKNGLIPRLPRVPYLFVKLTWLSVWMIALGMGAIAFLPDYRVTLLHVVFIGGFSLMTFSIATMVVMSHVGEGEQLRSSFWILWVIAVGLALVLLKRIAVAFFPGLYFKFLGMAAGIWVFVAISWLCFVAPRIIKTNTSDEFERMHEEAKKQILNSSKGRA